MYETLVHLIPTFLELCEEMFFELTTFNYIYEKSKVNFMYLYLYMYIQCDLFVFTSCASVSQP